MPLKGSKDGFSSLGSLEMQKFCIIPANIKKRQDFAKTSPIHLLLPVTNTENHTFTPWSGIYLASNIKAVHYILTMKKKVKFLFRKFKLKIN